MINHPCYLISDFINYSDDHLALIITRKWMQRNNYRVYKPFTLKDRNGNEWFFEKDFISDGGTLPVLLSPLLRYNGKGMAGFFPHDLECDLANESGIYAIRAHGDAELSGHLIECDVNKWIARRAGNIVTGYGKYLKMRGKLK